MLTSWFRSRGFTFSVPFRCGLLLSTFFLFSSLSGAHPFHVTSAEAHLRGNGAIEVSVELNPTELEQAIRLWEPEGETPFRVEDADADERIAAYAREAFTVASALSSGWQAMEFSWVGAELGLSTGWLYFEFKPTSAAGTDARKRFRVTNRLLVEAADFTGSEQLNTVRFALVSTSQKKGSDAQRISLTFSQPEYSSVVDFEPAPRRLEP